MGWRRVVACGWLEACLSSQKGSRCGEKEILGLKPGNQPNSAVALAAASWAFFDSACLAMAQLSTCGEAMRVWRSTDAALSRRRLLARRPRSEGESATEVQAACLQRSGPPFPKPHRLSFAGIALERLRAIPSLAATRGQRRCPRPECVRARRA